MDLQYNMFASLPQVVMELAANQPGKFTTKDQFEETLALATAEGLAILERAHPEWLALQLELVEIKTDLVNKQLSAGDAAHESTSSTVGTALMHSVRMQMKPSSGSSAMELEKDTCCICHTDLDDMESTENIIAGSPPLLDCINGHLTHASCALAYLDRQGITLAKELSRGRHSYLPRHLTHLCMATLKCPMCKDIPSVRSFKVWYYNLSPSLTTLKPHLETWLDTIALAPHQDLRSTALRARLLMTRSTR